MAGATWVSEFMDNRGLGYREVQRVVTHGDRHGRYRVEFAGDKTAGVYKVVRRRGDLADGVVETHFYLVTRPRHRREPAHPVSESHLPRPGVAYRL